MKTHHNKSLWATLIALLVTVSTYRVEAQTHTMVFSPTDPGTSYSITNWGLDTCWPNSDNMQRGLIYMGTNNVTIVRVGFFVDAPLTNNDVTPGDKSSMQTCINLASMATAATRWDLNLSSSLNSWYQSGTGTVYPDRWAAAMEACQRYYNTPFWSAEGFNEPDYSPNGEGSPQNLYDIFGYLQASTNFPGTAMEGGSTLNDDVALSTWFDAISPRATIGSTHCLAGSAASYMTFLQSVTASNAMAFNPELHNVMEAILGVNYGLKGGIWWGTAERARGGFVNACQGKRLAYADDLNNWTAAAVYRGTDGAVHAFLGGSERMATTTTYWLFSKDRAVFYDGYGPKHDYVVTVPGGTGYQQNQPNAERVVDITWGSDAAPAINGRYLVINRNSGLVLEVPGGSTNNGTFLDQNTYGGQLYQQWDINPLPNAFGGDVSYYSLKAAHDGVTADDYNWSYANGNQFDQWNGGTNVLEQWILQYAGNGYFKIRNRWDNKVMGVLGASTNTGAAIVQWDDTGSLDQQWRLIPSTVLTYHLTGGPATPTGVTATANAVSVQLNWNANTESDLAGYTVLRATNSGGPYDIIARGLTNTAFADGSANQSQLYYYVVAANDKSLNQSAYSSQVSATPTLGQTMVADYTFDNTSADSSGNGNDAELINSPAYTTGKTGSAISLNGSGQSVVVPTGIMNTSSNFTIAAWVYWNGGNAWQRIFDFGNSTMQYMLLTPSSGSSTLRFAVSTNGYGAEQQLNTSPMPTGQWFHVAVTYNGTTGYLYTNGVLAASGAITIPPTSFNPVANFLGQSQFPADPTFNGSLDDVYIFNYALTGTQVANLANGILPSAPAAPTALSATGGNLVVNLAWTQSTSPSITSNNVYRSTSGSGGPYNLLASLAATTSYSDTAVNAGSTYFYSVTAVNSGGESGLSAYSGATTIPAVPTGLTAAPGNAQVALSWTASTGATSYHVKRSTTSGGPYTTVASPTTASYTDTGLTNGTTYYYVVSAVDSGGESANSSQVSPTPSTVALLAYLKFDETSGTTTADATGDGWSGTLFNGATFVSGYSNNAVSLASASSQYVTLPGGVVSALSNFTIAAWVNLTSVANWNRVFDFGNNTTVYMFLTPQNGATGKVRYAITTSSNTGEQQINSSSVVPTNGWHHLAVTLSGTVGILYLDGAAVGTNSAMTLNPSSLGATSNNYLGKSQWNDPYLNGKMDEFRIYNGALSASQVAALAVPTAPTGLTATAQRTAGTIKLTWTQSTSLNITTNNVYRATVSGGPYAKVASIAATTSYTNSGLTGGTTYYYVVTAVSSTGVESAYSNQASAKSN